MKVLMIDNYDSFTYNLAHLFGELGAEVAESRHVRRARLSIELLAGVSAVDLHEPGQRAAVELDVRALEQRLQHGSELLATGRDP